MIEDSFKAFDEIKEKYNLVKRKTTDFLGAKMDTWTFSDALNAMGFVIGYKLGFAFAEKCFYDTVDDCIKFVGVIPIEPSNFDNKIKSLREMFDKANLRMKQYRMKNELKKLKEILYEYSFISRIIILVESLL